MNHRSLKFQLVAWYAGLLAGCFVFLGVVTYIGLQGFLVGSLKDTQLRRARQVDEFLLETVPKHGEASLGSEIDARHEPAFNERFIRVTRADGKELYRSGAPRGKSFDPAAIPAQAVPARNESVRIPLPGNREMLLVLRPVTLPGGGRYLVETGAPMDAVQADLHRWLIFLLAGLPATALIAIGGGYFLVRRALRPVDQIVATAEKISSHNLSERLPVPMTGDELQRLSTALNHMIERLDQAFQYSRRFVADASHELRTPLTVLRGELESLVQEPSLTPEWQERLGSALEEVLRLSRIVEGLFAISRLDAGEAAAEWVRFDLAQLATSTTDQMALMAEDKGIKVNCAASKGVWVEGDRARMKQVVVNLLDNAIKYTPRGGAVGLTVGSSAGRAVLEVADNGVGIPEEALPQVFDRFFRVDKARSREFGGAGLGLSIVKSICTAHEGKVEVSSEPGQGSVFRVVLPLVEAPGPKTNGTQSHESRSQN